MSAEDVNIIADLAQAAVSEAHQAVKRKMALAFTPAMSGRIGVLAYAMLEAHGRSMRKLLGSPVTDELVDNLEKDAVAKSMDNLLDTLTKRAEQAAR